MRRYGLHDDEWERIKDLLPGREGDVGVTAKDNRLFVEAVLYRYRTGMPWRDLPERFGAWKAVHTRFTRWAKTGVWERVFKHLAADADNEYAMIDSTIVRAHPRAIHDQRTASTYLFGAVCPEHGTGAALVLPSCNTEAMQLHLDEIASKVSPGAHAILILDQAGWHGAKDLDVPSNISLLPLPPRAPELNGQENIWQFMRQNWLSNRIFKSFDDIVDHCCYAWNTLVDQPWKIMSIAHRDWATGHAF